MPHLPAEARLLFLAVRSRTAAGDAALAELVRSPLNWHAVAVLADRERLLPILWGRLREHTSVLPPSVAAELRRHAAVAEFRLTVMETELQRVVHELADADIRVMLLKGAALAKTAYASFAERPMGDLDILVRRHEAERAWQLLRASGWKLFIEGGEKFFEAHHHLPRLVHPQGLQVELEVHRTLTHPLGPFVLDDLEVWRDARTVSLGGMTAFVPSNQHQLLHLSIHFAWSHGLSWGMGRTVRDVATLVGQNTMEWPAFVALAKRTKAATCAYWTLAMSRTLAGANAPSDVLEALRPPLPSPILQALERAYVMSAVLGSCPSLRLGRLLWKAGIRPGASGHGSVRPWKVSDDFEAIVAPRRKAPVGQRVADQLGDSTRWLRFAKVLSVPGSMV